MFCELINIEEKLVKKIVFCLLFQIATLNVRCLISALVAGMEGAAEAVEAEEAAVEAVEAVEAEEEVIIHILVLDILCCIHNYGLMMCEYVVGTCNLLTLLNWTAQYALAQKF